MPIQLSYLAFLFQATIVEYKETLYLCFCELEDANKCKNYIVDDNKIDVEYWSDLECWTLKPVDLTFNVQYDA